MKPASSCSALLLAAVLLTAPSVANEGSDTAGVRFAGGPARVELVELFTSEGCSSCPPADRWLSSLKTNPNLWQTFVPVAFHVDYWDYIGWTDRFARPEFGQRQRRYAEEGGARFVATPGMFRNGGAWEGWRRGDADFSNGGTTGVLSVAVNGAVADVDFEAATGGRFIANVAVLGMNRISKVDAGENVGKVLRQDFVVLDFTSRKLTAQNGRFRGRIALANDPLKMRDVAVVAWVSAGDKQAPVQAAGIAL